MANICEFSMRVTGSRENTGRFFDAMVQNGDVWMGRGAEAEIRYYGDHAIICGHCKWSVRSSLIDDAVSMEKQRTTGEGCWYSGGGMENVRKFVTLYEACRIFQVNMEVRSAGCDEDFTEHYRYENGSIAENEEESQTDDQEIWHFTPASPAGCMADTGSDRGEYRSAECGDYSPSCPWLAPGMSIKDFI